MTRDEAVEAIERMKTVRPTCEKCETHPFVALLREPDYCPEGFEPMAHCAGYIKRCDACANARTFPWADKLDPDKVVAFANSDPRCKHAFNLDLLKETLCKCESFFIELPVELAVPYRNVIFTGITSIEPTAPECETCGGVCQSRGVTAGKCVRGSRPTGGFEFL